MTVSNYVDGIYRLKPLSACIRMALAGSVFIGSAAQAELPIPAQVWATMGEATHQVTGDTLRIDQQTDRAILNWDSFNVGANNQVEFHQPNSSSIALNRIFQDDASQILGKVTANGQIYLYNQNGFVFGKDSTVDVNTLVTTTLNISDEVFQRGIVREFDDTGKAALDGSANNAASITVDPGANIHIGKNGRLIMAAPTVANGGNISADEQGQIILVASKDKVYLQQADSKGPFSGLLVEVGKGGKVDNLGNILARQGNVTLAGAAVNQNGRITATTSVNVNGSIRLLAREAAEKQSQVLVATKTVHTPDPLDNSDDGLDKVTFGTGSSTQIIADPNSDSAIDEQSQPASYLEVSGNTIHMLPGSSIVAPGAKVNMTATNNLAVLEHGNKGRILLDQGALIDVSGTKNVVAPIGRNVVDLPVQTYELRDSPLQKGGVLQGQTIQVDLRKDTQIVDTSGAVARFKRSIDERLGTGGEINLNSSGDVIVNAGAVVNISGGSIAYQDGYINTTKLLTDYGKIVDISDADPNEHYVSIYGVVKETHEKWGVTEIFDNQPQFSKGYFEQGYTQGLAAGTLNIVAPKLAWNGDLMAGSAASPYQRSSDTIAFGGKFSLDTALFESTQGVLFQSEKNLIDIAINTAFPKNKQNKPADLVLSSALTNHSGLQNLSITTLSSVTVAADANIDMKPGSQFTLDAGRIDVQGNIYSAGGSVNLFSRNTGIPKDAGIINVGSQTNINVSGRWVNDYALGQNATPTEALAIQGGAIKMVATGDLNLNSGSSIKADGGAWLALNSKLTPGAAGNINLSTLARTDSKSSLLHLNSSLSAYGLANGGSLSLSSGKIMVGDASAKQAASALVLGVHNGQFDFAGQSGFNKINLASTVEDITVKGNTSLSLVQQNPVLQNDFKLQPSSQSIAGFSQLATLPEQLRHPVDFTLTALKNIKLETGSQILADKQAAISLASTVGGIYVDGLINAPAGSINLAIKADPGVEYNAAQAIGLGGHASLLASGTTRMNPLDALGRHTGNVLDGGKILLTAQRGYIITEQGSQMDVSGTRAILDLPVNDGSFHYVSTEIGSNAGGIALVAAEGGVLDGSLKGFAGSSTTLGARLDVALDRTGRNPPNPALIPFPSGDLVLNVVQATQPVLGKPPQYGKAIPTALNAKMTVSADNISAGGFSDVRLRAINDASTPDFTANVNFSGDVNLAAGARIDIDAPSITWSGLNGATTGNVNLNTAFLRIGSSTLREPNSLPVTGGGIFTAHSQWTELGGASLWNGYSQVNLNSEHDLRTVGLVDISPEHRDYVGTLATAGDLNLSASQIYPATLTHFTFKAGNQISIAGNGNSDKSPLSAAGILNFEAPIINQDGVVKAPFGNINLTASSRLTLGENSLTSVSGNGQLIPFGLIQGGFDWLYPLDNNHNLVFATPPEKKLTLSAPTVNLAKGSVIDLSGGGDLLAYEFLPGSGGSYDYLNASTDSGKFAVVPNLGSDIAPYDPLQSADFNYSVGRKVYLNGTADLPAGQYTMLPAHYALMPGAFLVTPQSNTQDLTTTTSTKAGLPIVAGYQTLAGTAARNPRWSGYLIESGTDIRKHSEYSVQTANTFYAAQAAKNGTSTPILPIDSGQISIAAEDQLALQGEFKVATAGFRGARMDIAANRLKIVNALSATPTAGTLEVLASDLSSLGVDSLFLGGGRSQNVTTGATDLQITSEQVTFDTGALVTVSDLIAAATDKVEVKSGAVLTASGNINTGNTLFNVNGDDAFLRISGDKQISLNKTSTLGNAGELLVEAGATLAASKSMLLDASKSTTLDGDIRMKGGSLSLSANSINIGEVSGLASGALNLSNEKLQNLAVDELLLSSRDTVNFYGNVAQADNSAIKFDSLRISAAGFSGFASPGQTAKLQANTLYLQNLAGAVATQAATGQGNLELSANNYNQGSGNFSINGFQNNTVNVAGQFNATGDGVLTVGGALNMNVGTITAVGGSHLKLDASGYAMQVNNLPLLQRGIEGDLSNQISPNPSFPKRGTDTTISFGGAINLVADAIDFNAKALMPSGSLAMEALKGDVNIAENADINLAGQAVSFADTVDYTPGGTFSAVADHGKITLAENSAINLSTGGGSASGGKLILKAFDQTVDLLGNINANGGSAELDVSGFSANGGFDKLMNTLGNAGISDDIYFRSRDADIMQSTGQAIKANSITLVADHGAISLSGNINGGVIGLYAGDIITLENGAQLTATGNQGGNIKLSSIDNDNDHVSGINIKAGSLLDVSGATPETGGEVTLRALRTADSINIQPIAGTVQGTNTFYAEGVKKYSILSVAGEINSNDISTIKNDTDAYMTATAIQKVSGDLGSGIRLRAGIEIDYAGDLALNSPWDLVGWRYTSGSDLLSPGTLTINTTGNFTLNNSLSDGFKDGLLLDFVNVKDMLQTGASWSYQLTAGADLSSADTLATASAKNLAIGSGVTVRTGTGDIQLGAGGDVTLADQTSTVYNAGRADDTHRYGTLGADIAAFLLYSEYPIDGGDLTIKADNNIQGAVSNQFIDSWLLRFGSWTDGTTHANEFPTAWGVALGYTTDGYGNAADASAPLFQQNIGSFAGGKVNISAAGNINNLSVMMPTTGKQIGSPDNDPATFSDFLTNEVDIQGGGQMQVTAGANIAGGAFLLGKGQGSISAGGAITGSADQFVNGPQIAMGDTQLNLNANSGIRVSAVSDPMILHSGNAYAEDGSNFFSYTGNSGIALKSLSGDLHVGADTRVIGTPDMLNLTGSQASLSKIYPASLQATAFGGSFMLDDQVTLFPSASSTLSVLAKNNITSTVDSLRLSMSDADPALLPDAMTPLARNLLSDAEAILNPFGINNLVHAAVPMHLNDKQPVRLVTQQGDIKSIQVNVPKQAIIQSGNDINNILVNIQHVNDGDVSILSAARNIRFTSERSVDGLLVDNFNELKISGPGNVLVKAGGNIDLGASGGLSTIGNLSNPNLSSDVGSAISVLAGLNNQSPDYAAFLNFVKNTGQYSQQYGQMKALLIPFMQAKLGDPTLSADAALKAFSTLTADAYLPIQPQLNALVNQVFFNELKESGTASSSSKSAGNERGFAIIDTLFPGANWKGDLSLFFSKLQTLQGGDINLLVPGGEINAGLAVSFSGAKAASELGIVAQGQGDINAFVRDNFIVNQSRVFALSGGRILIWSSEGDIDAGRGAKSAIAAPPPEYSFDDNGNLVVTFPPIVSGSGIRTAATAGNKAGDVFLFAPKGVVNAGEAGIEGNNVTISATAVLGANNIQVGGISSGVPAASSGSLAAGLSGVSNLSASVSQVAQASADMSKNNEESNSKNAKLGILSVDVIGYGEGGGSETKKSKKD